MYVTGAAVQAVARHRRSARVEGSVDFAAPWRI
jgi:hypothetical protein